PAFPVPQPGSLPASYRGQSCRGSLIKHSSSLKIEPEPDFRKAFFAHGMTKLHLVAGVEHQETAAAGADHFAAQRAVGHGELVPGIDVTVTHCFRALLLPMPMHIHQACEFLQLAALQRLLALFTEVLDEMKILCHGRVGLFALVVLLPQNRRGAARVTSKEEQQVV